jgi:CheY-like chemotaxis protein
MFEKYENNSIFEVVRAFNGEDAVRKFEKRIKGSCKNLSCTKYQFKLILMDLQMPIKDGFEACEEILKI